MTASLTGGPTVTQNYALGTCTLTVKDGNGQSEPVLVTVAASQTIPSTTSYSMTLSCHEEGPTGDQTNVCSNYKEIDLGTFTSATNSAEVSASYSTASDTSSTGLTTFCVGLEDTTNGNYYPIAGGSGTWSVKMAAGTGTDTYRLEIFAGTTAAGTWDGNPVSWTMGASFYNLAANSGTTSLTAGTLSPSCEP